jgi:hypothetical protein
MRAFAGVFDEGLALAEPAVGIERIRGDVAAVVTGDEDGLAGGIDLDVAERPAAGRNGVERRQGAGGRID